ncbi:MAG: anaerobic ribonucleoside-triphosphate reductase activating protein [Armatimonadetes bacterium]|nr:anaerobic ribonucleoside-triphosphate reductase activating protein [Armatimonadota bacterium]
MTQYSSSELSEPIGVIAGIQPVSLLDFPGRVAAVLFLGGCNMRCPYCHNVSLVAGPWREVMSLEELEEWLAKRAGFLDGVCITGGEPTLAEERLVAICSIARNCGLPVKVDTNGTRPAVIDLLLRHELVDYVAVDVKAGPGNYAKAAGVDVDVKLIASTVGILRARCLSHELRTTVVPDLHDLREIQAIGEWLGGDSPYFLQPFRPGPTLDPRFRALPQPDENLLAQLAAAARPYFRCVTVRG